MGAVASVGALAPAMVGRIAGFLSAVVAGN